MKRTPATTTTLNRSAAVLTIGVDDQVDVGAILRRTTREQPRALLVWIDGQDHIARAELIAELRRRRPRLPLVAVTSEPSARIEQAVRVAGASFYLPLICAEDQRLLHQTLQTLGIDVIEPPIPREHSGLPPPTTRGSPDPPGKSNRITRANNKANSNGIVNSSEGDGS